ncbi:MAG: hypothetical protein SNF33_05245 [Candidatus Algichlamydia australiensis]|nr:hypothetical protein [Chlamydiales bacterium]
MLLTTLSNCCTHHYEPDREIAETYLELEKVFGKWTLPLARLLIQDTEVLSKWAPIPTKIPLDNREIEFTWCKEELETRVKNAYKNEEREFFVQIINFWSELEGREWNEGFYFHWIYIVYRIRTILENSKENCGEDFWICIRHFVDGAQLYGWWDKLLNLAEGSEKEKEIQRIPFQVRQISKLRHEDKQALLSLMTEVFSNSELISGVGDWEYYNDFEASSLPNTTNKKKEGRAKVHLIAGIALITFGIIGGLYYYGKLDRLLQYTKDFSRKTAPPR